LGAGVTGRRVVRALQRSPLDGLHPVALFDDDPAVRGRRVEGVRVRGPLTAAEAFAVRHNVGHAIVAISQLDARRIDELTNARSRVFRRVQFVPRVAGVPSTDVRASDLDGLLALEVKIGLASPLNRAVKRTFDVAAVLLGGLAISPLLLLLMAAVYLDSPGPVFFGHARIGRDGRRFTTWKFRSMVPDAPAVLERYLRENPELRSEWEATRKLRDDPRVTRVGRFLRATSLDELPQIWNVLTGEMSLVGPRPIVDEEVPKYGHVFDLYRMVRPGITGYWQVSGRSDTSYANRVAMDAHYVRNWSVWFDLVILVRTAGVVVRRDGAY
jgi:Undecaprenyl-phosphate galactose phosphotransferase WbaP